MLKEPELLENPSRRHFLSVLVGTDTAIRQGRRLSRVKSISKHTEGVLWALEGSQLNDIFVAGDDGVIFHYDEKSWQHEPIGTDLPIHALCRTTDGNIIAVGWLGLICERREGQWHYVQGGHQTRESVDVDEIRINLPLFDVASSPSGDTWAVGDMGRVVCFDGHSWNEIDSGVRVHLRCVLPLPDGTVLVAGADGVVLRYREGEWHRIVTDTACYILSLTAFSSNDIYAVGGEYSSELTDFIGRIFHLNGDDWIEIKVDQSLPRLRRIRREGDGLLIAGDSGGAFRYDKSELIKLAPGVRYDLHDVITTSTGRTIFCGDGGTVLVESETEVDETESTVILERNIIPDWETMFQHTTNKILRGLWAASSGVVYAVGDAGTILRFDGNRWEQLPAPKDVRLHGVWGTSADNVYACGDAATIFHFDGSNWELDYCGDVDTALLSITGFGPHDIFVVGDDGIALRYDGVQWRRMQTGTQYELYKVWGLDAEHVLAVGGAGTILRWDGQGWESFSTNTDNDLFAVWGDKLDRIFLGGLSGTLIRFTGNSWQKEFSGVRTDLHAIGGWPGGPVFAVGSQGTVLRNNDDQWEFEDCHTDVSLRTITVTEDNVFAAGTNGIIIRRSLY